MCRSCKRRPIGSESKLHENLGKRGVGSIRIVQQREQQYKGLAAGANLACLKTGKAASQCDWRGVGAIRQ